MKKLWVNYWVDMVTGTAFLLCAVTGVVFLFLPGLVQTSGGEATILGVDVTTWHWVHDWSGVVMTAGVGLHLALHARWLANMTRRLGRDRRAAGAPGHSRERARTVSPGTKPLVAAGEAGAAAAALERLRRLDAGRPSRNAPPRISRKAFLAGAAVAGGAALLVGVGLSGRGASGATVTRTGGRSSDDLDPGGRRYGEGDRDWSGQDGDSADGSSGGSSGSQSGTTTTSDRVAVSSTSCVGCGHCLPACPYGVFDWTGSGTVTASHPDACALCGRCLQVCPTSAITLNA
jgi:NAD-dependent dihydropyrimidine dehydrogenase PreA subunit